MLLFRKIFHSRVTVLMTKPLAFDPLVYVTSTHSRESSNDIVTLCKSNVPIKNIYLA